jgi:branched-chain amino acid transport system permease protein
MVKFIASLVGGAALGGTFALIGLGLVLAFRATKTFNFAHGEMMLLPALIVGFAQTRNVSLGLALAVALVVSALVGALFYVLVLRRTTGLPLFMGIIATFGLAAILDGIMGLKFGANQYTISLPLIPTGHAHIGGATVSQSSLVLAGVTIAASLVIAAVIRFTHLGIVIRAAGQDAVLASQCGIHVRRIYLGSWAAAGVLAGIAGIIYGSESIASSSMIELGLAALPAIVLGGLDSVEGAVVGGVLVGILQGFTATYLGGTYVDVTTYVLLIIVLLFYPQGMFGTKQVIRA